MARPPTGSLTQGVMAVVGLWRWATEPVRRARSSAVAARRGPRLGPRRGSWALVLAVATLTAACAQRAPARQPGVTSVPAPAAGPLQLDRVLAQNPGMAGSGYGLRPATGPGLQGLSVYGRGGTPGQVELLVDGARTVVAVRAVLPSSAGLQPWYDQAAPSAGTAAGQGGALRSAVAASNASSSTAAEASGPSATASRTYPSGTGDGPSNTSSPLGAPSNSAPLLGSSSPVPAGVSSAAAVYTQTVWLAPGPGGPAPSVLPTLATLRRLNPTLSRLQAQTPLLPGRGVYYGPKGYGLFTLVDRSGRLVGFMAWLPPAAGWQPFYDQLPGHEDIAPLRYLKGYTQHVWLLPPADIS
jgi:hypothetical protein